LVGAQGPPAWPRNPATHWHDSTLSLPAGLVVLARQEKQAVAEVAPLDALYVPMGHSEHAALPVVGLKRPGWHLNAANKQTSRTDPHTAQ
jgi:hypothetical protein